MCTLMAGIILVILGLTGLGTAVKYIPRPVVVGFTNGIAVLIASTQIKDFFGIQLADVPSHFAPRLHALAERADTFSPAATSLAVPTRALLMGWNRFVRRVPGYIVALLTATAAIVIFRLPVETIGSRF